METTRRRFFGLLPAGIAAAALAPFVAKAAEPKVAMTWDEMERITRPPAYWAEYRNEFISEFERRNKTLRALKG